MPNQHLQQTPQHPHRSADRSPSGTWQPDGQWDNWFVEISISNSLRDIRGVLTSMVCFLDREGNPQAQAMCVLINSKISMQRLDEELLALRSILRQDLAPRIHVSRFDEGELHTAESPGPDFPGWLIELVRVELGRASSPGATQFSVFAHLVRSWLRGEPPQAISSIQGAVGASYPTVAAVLTELETHAAVERTSNRRVRLRKFPWDEWRRWVVASSEQRKTVRYADPTGHARTPEDMAARLTTLGRKDVAISGVLGAKHHFPDLDITGSARLDLTIHGSEKTADLGFIRKLDPALQRVKDPTAKAVVVVHFLGTRTESHFEADECGLWADAIECLADLYELRLDAQADEMLQSLIRDRTTQPQTRSKP